MANARTTDDKRYKLETARFLAAAGLAYVLSIALWFAGSHEAGILVGVCVPSILAAGALWLSALQPS